MLKRAPCWILSKVLCQRIRISTLLSSDTHHGHLKSFFGAESLPCLCIAFPIIKSRHGCKSESSKKCSPNFLCSADFCDAGLEGTYHFSIKRSKGADIGLSCCEELLQCLDSNRNNFNSKKQKQAGKYPIRGGGKTRYCLLPL